MLAQPVTWVMLVRPETLEMPAQAMPEPETAVVQATVAETAVAVETAAEVAQCF